MQTKIDYSWYKYRVDKDRLSDAEIKVIRVTLNCVWYISRSYSSDLREYSLDLSVFVISSLVTLESSYNQARTRSVTRGQISPALHSDTNLIEPYLVHTCVSYVIWCAFHLINKLTSEASAAQPLLLYIWTYLLSGTLLWLLSVYLMCDSIFRVYAIYKVSSCVCN